MLTWRSAFMLLMFMFTGAAVLLLVVCFVIAEARDAIRARSRGSRTRATGRWRYEAVQHK